MPRRKGCEYWEEYTTFFLPYLPLPYVTLSLTLSTICKPFFIRDNPKSFTYSLICESTTELNILLSFSFMRKKTLDCILHYEILWHQIKRSGKYRQTMLMPCKTQREKSTLTNGEDLFRQREIIQCFPGRIIVSTVWILISRTKQKKLQYTWNKGIFATGVLQYLLNEYSYSAFWSYTAMCVKS